VILLREKVLSTVLCIILKDGRIHKQHQIGWRVVFSCSGGGGSREGGGEGGGPVGGCGTVWIIQCLVF
jgi:hypothetical protein